MLLDFGIVSRSSQYQLTFRTSIRQKFPSYSLYPLYRVFPSVVYLAQQLQILKISPFYFSDQTPDPFITNYINLLPEKRQNVINANSQFSDGDIIHILHSFECSCMLFRFKRVVKFYIRLLFMNENILPLIASINMRQLISGQLIIFAYNNKSSNGITYIDKGKIVMLNGLYSLEFSYL